MKVIVATHSRLNLTFGTLRTKLGESKQCAMTLEATFLLIFFFLPTVEYC